MEFFRDAITYRGNSWGHAAVGVAFEFSLIAAFGVVLWSLS